MISPTSKKPDVRLRKGQIIIGKWHKRQYQVIRLLGSGAIGTVYLCLYQNRKVALKMSIQSAAITSEVNVLKSFQAVQGHHLGPALIDVDDYVTSAGHHYAFYIMEYISGDTLTSFINQNGNQWLSPLLLGLVKDLEVLHKQGYVFGDLKLENLIVARNPAKLRWVDVGGTTWKGRAIKEYTEFYDRAYWGCGTRKADAGYDLFALAMVILRVYYPDGFARGQNPRKTLRQKIDQAVDIEPLKHLLKQLVDQTFHEAGQVHRFLLTHAMKRQTTRAKQVQPINEPLYPVVEMIGVLTVGAGYCLYLML
ncbi:protein kinase domain-containing protein [Gracilibacillus alcaliphilus]|uniref:protein kinase domain-containing protein n=1 Tax=Gracilibacillus alcaliphilus TaxID=1401441 RepID=UPI001958FD20|nr:serine/threonine-protein kinase [Gracilibacillus alcaliphilus]MBM7678147.1 serine/threonine-protein kinase [Gracilibacillus alcaliphilus]